MTVDATTETIAHFIGVLQLYVDEARMRMDYDKFRAIERAEEDAEYRTPTSPNIKTGYRLKDFDPKLKVKLTAEDGFDLSPGPGMAAFAGLPMALPLTLGPIPYPEYPTLPPMVMDPGLTIELDVPPASSVFVYSYQRATLSDNDLLTQGHGTVFASPDMLHQELAELAEVALASRAFVIAPLDGLSGGHLDYALAAADAIAAVQEPADGGFQVSIMVGADAQGIFVDGARVDEFPDWADYMPAYHEIEDEADAAGEDEEPGMENPNHPDGDNPYHVEDGHNVVTGANIAVNEAHVASAWLDAPVFAVQGAVVNIDAISQVNVLMDRDAIPGYSSEDGISDAVNVAQFLTSSSQPEGGGTEAGSGSPFHWEVTRIEGDIIQINWLQQFTFATDFDMAEVAFSGANTFISMGENLIVNAASLLELGFYYDLIIIGGDMINLSMISQTNVLLDGDDVIYTGGAADMMSGGDNLVFNGASVTTEGVDTYGELTQPFRDALDDLGNGGSDLPGSVARDALFDGKDTLSVLYIDGDFTTLNLVEQTNIVGDSDQVHLLLDDFAETTDGEVTVTTGSNALLNNASIAEYGLDSVVLSGEGAYSDALIYQAELIDTEADPNGVAMSAPLTSEAVAFLADDMVDGGQADGEIASAAVTNDADSADVMQTMLA